MVDYFYLGYETYGIKSGMTMLEEHINNPNCLTINKIQIRKRIEGIQKLVVGSKTPDFTLIKDNGEVFNLYLYQSQKKYKLILFWSADCDHCQKLVVELDDWNKQNLNKVEVIAISLDQTESEVTNWINTKNKYSDWLHLIGENGINSHVANDYSILSTPYMFLVDSENKIVSSPMNVSELNEFLIND